MGELVEKWEKAQDLARPLACIEEIYRLLKPNGMGMLYINIFELQKIIRKILDVIDKTYYNFFYGDLILLLKPYFNINFKLIKDQLLGVDIKTKMMQLIGIKTLYLIWIIKNIKGSKSNENL